MEPVLTIAVIKVTSWKPIFVTVILVEYGEPHLPPVHVSSINPSPLDTHTTTSYEIPTYIFTDFSQI